MGKMKNISLKHKGYKFTGKAEIELWGGGTGSIDMISFTLPSRKLTSGNIKRSINDGHFGCKDILSATVEVYDLYDNEYTQYNRTITLNKEQCQEALRKGITI